MDLEYADNVPGHVWEKFVSNDQNSYFFNTPVWAKIIEQTYGYKIATRLYKVNNDEVLIPMMMKERYGFKTFDSMPLGYGNIYSTATDPSRAISSIMHDLIKDTHLLFYLFPPPFSGISIPANTLKRDLILTDDYAHILTLEKGFDHIWEHIFTRTVRKAVRKAEKSDIQVSIGNSVEDFERFYNLFVESSIRWGYSKPPEPLALYQNMFRYGSQNVKLRLAYKDERPIAGLIRFNYGRNIFVWKTSFMKEYSSCRAVDLLMRDSIREACAEGYKVYNLGSSAGISGVQRFKENFGARQVHITRYTVATRLGKMIRQTLFNYNLLKRVTSAPIYYIMNNQGPVKVTHS